MERGGRKPDGFRCHQSASRPLPARSPEPGFGSGDRERRSLERARPKRGRRSAALSFVRRQMPRSLPFPCGLLCQWTNRCVSIWTGQRRLNQQAAASQATQAVGQGGVASSAYTEATEGEKAQPLPLLRRRPPPDAVRCPFEIAPLGGHKLDSAATVTVPGSQTHSDSE
jgi:hypothetical protein